MSAESKPLDRAAAIEAFLADKRAAIAAPTPANDTTSRPRRPIDPEARSKLVEYLRQNPLCNRAAAGRRFGLDRHEVKIIVRAERDAGHDLPKLAAGKPPRVATGICKCGLPAVAGSSRCARCARLGPPLTPRRGRVAREKDQTRPDPLDVDADGKPLHRPSVKYVPAVRDLEAEKGRAAERARLLAELPADRITRVAPAPDLFREAIERTQRFAAERFEGEAKADAKARAKRHRQYQLDRVRSRRQEALDRRDRVGEFALDRAIPYAEDRFLAFREAVIVSNGRRRAVDRVSFGISDDDAKSVVDQLIAEGLIPARGRASAAKENATGCNEESDNETSP